MFPSANDIRHRAPYCRALAILGSVFLLASGLHAAEPLPPPNIVLSAGNIPTTNIEVRRLPSDVIEAARKLPADDARWRKILAVRVDTGEKNLQESGANDRGKSAATPDQPAMLGTYAVSELGIMFKPRFPLDRELTYRATFDSSELRHPNADRIRITKEFLLPAKPASGATRLMAIFPTANELPENLLRIYLHFSAPMQQGDAYKHIRLIDDRGQPVDRPFLELPEELWNSDGTRLTLLLDPGRVKQGLKPRAEAGPILVAGHTYTLVVDASWPDVEGGLLPENGRKTFQVTAPDMTQPDPRTWKVSAPRAGTRDPLSLRFPEPLDEAMLHRVLQVVPSAALENSDSSENSASERAIEGTIRVTETETLWKFTPREAWKAGAYSIVASTTLEDRAGNSIQRAFEVDLNRLPGDIALPSSVSIEFEVRP